MGGRSCCACVILLVLVACGGGSLESDSAVVTDSDNALDQPQTLSLTVAGDRVTVDAVNVTLGRLMAALSEASGLIVAPSGSLTEVITLRFDALPMEAALAQILSGRNYVLEMHPLVVHVLNHRLEGERDVVAEFALTDPDKAVRMALMFDLGTGEAPPRELLESALLDPDSSVRLEAIEAIRRLDEENAVALLEFAFGDADESVREVAVEALGAFEGSDRSLQMLVGALNDPNPVVREEAVYVLWKIGSAPAVALLETALTDPHPAVRSLVAERLEALRH